MNDKTAQPGLDALSKSFEPAAIESRWGPWWEQRGFAQSKHRSRGERAHDVNGFDDNRFALRAPPAG